jgi:hypothetical protein
MPQMDSFPGANLRQRIKDRARRIAGR